jgi:hypothetical protein
MKDHDMLVGLYANTPEFEFAPVVTVHRFEGRTVFDADWGGSALFSTYESDPYSPEQAAHALLAQRLADIRAMLYEYDNVKMGAEESLALAGGLVHAMRDFFNESHNEERGGL